LGIHKILLGMARFGRTGKNGNIDAAAARMA
jgi:hypothetical protein